MSVTAVKSTSMLQRLLLYLELRALLVLRLR
jgi:hypothetical protein